MGKYMRKTKITGEVAVMELPPQSSSLGVRTRAKTLALQKQNISGTSYLQLRSRRLEKPSLIVAASTNESKKPQNITCKQKPNPNPKTRTSSRLAVVSSFSSASVHSISGSCSDNKENLSSKDESINVVEEKGENIERNGDDLGIEASFGENILDFEGRDRSTRESTPCSLIRDSDAVGTPPGSSTRPTNSAAGNRRTQNTRRRNIPTTHEVDEFFSGAEQQEQKKFAEKYNFDPVTDKPLPGRYEWVKLDE